MCPGLDLGCGEGHNTRLLAASGANVVALDLSEYFIESAAAESRRGIRFVLGDGAHPEVADTRIAPYFLILRART